MADKTVKELAAMTKKTVEAINNQLVKAGLSARGDNEHQEYTNFWNRIRVDSEFHDNLKEDEEEKYNRKSRRRLNRQSETEHSVADYKKELAKTWKEIRTCKVEQWTDKNNVQTKCFDDP